jgi:hypothetical protein
LRQNIPDRGAVKSWVDDNFQLGKSWCGPFSIGRRNGIASAFHQQNEGVRQRAGMEWKKKYKVYIGNGGILWLSLNLACTADSPHGTGPIFC